MALTEHYFTKFTENKFYHVYYRSIDKKPMFYKDGNYEFFLKKYHEYLSPVIDTYAYNLLGNHFHLLVGIRSGEDLTTFNNLQIQKSSHSKLSNLETKKNKPIYQDAGKTSHEIVSHQFQKFFQSYAMAFNKQQNRIGTLFQTPYKRVLVENDAYFVKLIQYIHTNAELHGMVKDFRDWKWSSYHSFLIEKETKLKKQEVLNWYGSKNKFEVCHLEKKELRNEWRIFLGDDI